MIASNPRSSAQPATASSSTVWTTTTVQPAKASATPVANDNANSTRSVAERIAANLVFA